MAELEEPIAGVGHNKPPISEVLADEHAAVIREVDTLKYKFNHAPVTIAQPEQKAKVGEVVVPLGKMITRLDTLRTDANKPHLAAQRETNNWFNSFIDELKEMKKTLEDRATAYDRRVLEEERQRREQAAAAAQEEADRQATKAKEAAASGDLAGSAAADGKAEEAALAASTLEGSAPKAADVTRVRSGSIVGSSRTSWIGEITDIDNLDVVKLRPYLKREDLQKALNAYVRTGGRECAGAVIREDVKASFR